MIGGSGTHSLPETAALMTRVPADFHVQLQCPESSLLKSSAVYEV